MLPSGKYQVARPGNPSRQMTLSEINLGLAIGEVQGDDKYWTRGMPRWERVGGLSGVVLPAAPKLKAPVTHGYPGGSTAAITTKSHDEASGAEPPSFWLQTETRPRLAVWSPGLYVMLSFLFTPLMGTIMISQNHRATRETAWRGIVWFWLIVWSVFLLTGFSMHFAAIPCGPHLYWIIGFAALFINWIFTCALPHRGFLRQRTFEAAWRVDWGRPVGLGCLAWAVVFSVYLLTR